jgi:RecA/RadA recombinase
LIQLLSSLRKPVPLPSPLSALLRNLPTPGIIDIHSPSHTGKTHLLHHFITETLLPDYFPHHPVRLTASPHRAVLFIDCDARFDIHRLKTIITTYVKNRLAENLQVGFILPLPVKDPSSNEIEQLVTAALTRLYIFQPTSGMGLLSTVKGLTTFLSQAPHNSLTIGLICIDSISAFHHALRANEKLVEYYSHLSVALRSLSTLFGVPVITTSWSLFTQTTPQNDQTRSYIGLGPSHPHSVSVQRPAWRQYFPREWLRGVECRIILQKREVRGFMDGMMLVEADMERERRMEVVRRGAVLGWLENDEGREFEMFITDEGVRFAM